MPPAGGGGAGGGGALTDGQVEATFLLPTGGEEIETRVPYDGGSPAGRADGR